MAVHPYSPASLDLPGYVPQRLSQLEIVGPYLGTSLFVLLAVWLLSGRCGRLSKVDRLLMCWWTFTGLTHLVVEGPFVFTPDFFSKENPSYFDEAMKEYSKGDSRYVGRDTATVTLEAITVLLEGPGSLLAVRTSSNPRRVWRCSGGAPSARPAPSPATSLCRRTVLYAIASRKSYSHILQFTVCLGQLYGCIVYFATAYLDGFNFWVSPFYFWAYFVGANSSWVVIPFLIARRSWKKICAAIHQTEKVKTK